MYMYDGEISSRKAWSAPALPAIMFRRGRRKIRQGRPVVLGGMSSSLKRISRRGALLLLSTRSGGGRRRCGRISRRERGREGGHYADDSSDILQQHYPMPLSGNRKRTPLS